MNGNWKGLAVATQVKIGTAWVHTLLKDQRMNNKLFTSLPCSERRESPYGTLYSKIYLVIYEFVIHGEDNLQSHIARCAAWRSGIQSRI